MFAFLKSIFGKPARPATRLSEADALEIAGKALDREVPLFVGEVKPRTDGVAGLEWIIGTATVGSGQTVRVDDATGAVIEVARWGVR